MALLTIRWLWPYASACMLHCKLAVEGVKLHTGIHFKSRALIREVYTSALSTTITVLVNSSIYLGTLRSERQRTSPLSSSSTPSSSCRFRPVEAQAYAAFARSSLSLSLSDLFLTLRLLAAEMTSGERVREAVNESLRRLRVESIYCL